MWRTLYEDKAWGYTVKSDGWQLKVNRRSRLSLPHMLANECGKEVHARRMGGRRTAVKISYDKEADEVPPVFWTGR